MSTETSPNPLAEAEPSSLDELFSRDPLGLSDQDISSIVRELRRQREKWLAEPEKKAAKKPASKPVKLDVSLDDLGI